MYSGNTYKGGQTVYLRYVYLYSIYRYQQAFSMDKALFQLLQPSAKGSGSRLIAPKVGSYCRNQNIPGTSITHTVAVNSFVQAAAS